jgi:hypothetical protein
MRKLLAHSPISNSVLPRGRWRVLGLGWLLGTLALGACQDRKASPEPVTPGDGTDGPIDAMTSVPGNEDSEFVSSLGTGGASGAGLAVSSGSAGTAGSSAQAPEASSPASGGDAAARAISEADILQLDGDRLYALSRYNGLTVVNVSDPAALRVEGSYAAAAEPFEMYVEDGIVFAMFNSWYSYVCDDTTGVCEWQTTSSMQAIDARDPAHIALLSNTEIPGAIADSRRVGDVLYVATQEYGYCWGCQQQPNTALTSFNVTDPTHLVQVDQLRLPESNDSYAGQRSISVTDQRVYIGGYDWGYNGTSMPGSIQVVDISDPQGALVQGATVPIAGPIQSRWQMDEYDGVFRVVSQPGGWGTSSPPVVQTFRVNSSSDIQPLGSVNIQLPAQNEMLESVRFDGTRAYAITAEQRDPLFTFDLSDPAHPRQAGQLEMPGFVYHMEPRGDRVYALGYDSNNPDGALNVSLFDVSNIEQPALLSRVAFGGDWGNFAEGQNQIQKAFSILDEQGLILVPFSGGSYGKQDCSYDYGSGIQLIDVGGAQLAKRGVAPQVGDARRAFIHREHLFGIGDNTVQSFDISDRDAPVATGRVDVARNVSTVRLLGDHVLRFGNDWATQETVLDVAPLAQAASSELQAPIDLSALFGEDSWSCNGGSYWGGQVFTHGNYAYVPRYGYSYDQNGSNSQQHLTFYIVDLTDRSAPRAVGSFAPDAVTDQTYFADIVQTDHALLVGRTQGYYQYDGAGNPISVPKYYYDVFDLSDPSAPAVASHFEVPAQIAYGGWGRFIGGCVMDMAWGWYGGYGNSAVTLTDGDLVVSQHSEPLPGSDNQVKFYLDRMDVSDPVNPKLLPEVNIPGTAIHFNASSGELVTVDYQQTTEAGVDWNDCSTRGYYGYFDDAAQNCQVTRRSINSLVVAGERAIRKSQLLLDRTRRTGSIAVSNDRIFYTTSDFPKYAPGGYYPVPLAGNGGAASSTDTPAPDATTVTLESLRVQDGLLTRLPSVELRRQNSDYGYYGDLYARGTRAFSIFDNTMTVVDTAQPLNPRTLSHEMPGYGCQSLEVAPDAAYCAEGQRGVEVVDLSSMR